MKKKNVCMEKKAFCLDFVHMRVYIHSLDFPRLLQNSMRQKYAKFQWIVTF